MILRYEGERLAYMRDHHDGHYSFYELDGWDFWLRLLREGPTPIEALRKAAYGERLDLLKLLKSSSGIVRAIYYDLRTAIIDSPHRGYLYVTDPVMQPPYPQFSRFHILRQKYTATTDRRDNI